MAATVQDLLSTAAVVVAVGLAAVCLLVADLVRREVRESAGPLYLISGSVLTAAFLAVATIRFVTLGG